MKKSIQWGVGLVAVLFLVGGCKSTYSMKCISGGMTDSMSAAVVMPPAELSGGTEVGQPAATGNIEQTVKAAERMMTYDATVHVVVQNVSVALDKLKAMGGKLKGYMQSMSENSITLRVPADRLNEAFVEVAKLGEITSRSIEGDDVTEEMMDLDIRLRTSEETRNRLAELLKKSDKVEDLLKVEKEMQRVTEELELIKGRIKYLSHAVAYSTLKVVLNSPVSQMEQRETIPFDWVRGLATDIVLNPESSFTASRRWRSWLKMEWPSSFVKLSENEGRTRAMSGNGVMLLVRRQDNFEGGTPGFWTQIIRRWLVDNKVIALGSMAEVTLKTGAKGTEFVGTKEVGRKQYQYILVTVVNEDYIYTAECWGLAEEMAKEREVVEQSIRTLRVR